MRQSSTSLVSEYQGIQILNTWSHNSRFTISVYINYVHADVAATYQLLVQFDHLWMSRELMVDIWHLCQLINSSDEEFGWTENAASVIIYIATHVQRILFFLLCCNLDIEVFCMSFAYCLRNLFPVEIELPGYTLFIVNGKPSDSVKDIHLDDTVQWHLLFIIGTLARAISNHLN